MLKKPIFLVGCPRSGTTLLQQMLDAHPEVAIAPETHFIHYFWQRQERYGDLNEDSNYKLLLTDITALPEFSEMGLTQETFCRVAWQNQRSYGALLSLLLEQFARHRGVEIVGEKTPNHVLYLPQLQQFFPQARFIHLVRDPRAVVNSWRSVPWSTGSISQDAQAWRFHVGAPRRCGGNVRAAIFTLYYEQLVLAPEENLRALCRFLNLEFMPQMLTYHQKSAPLVNVSREPWKARAVKPVSQDRLTHWRTELSEDAIAQIEAVAWWEMRRLGYKAKTKIVRLLPTAILATIQHRLKRFMRKNK